MSTRILIIEDNPANMELMSYLLLRFGYEVDMAANGKQGLEKASFRPPDLVICDLEMPEMNGFEAGTKIKTVLGCEAIPLVAVTAFAMVGDRDKVLTAGFNGYLSKPIFLETFVAQIESFLPIEKRCGRAPVQFHQTSEPALLPEQTGRATILVVDDSPVNLSLFRSTLEPSGYGVVTAGTAQEAVEAAAQQRFDLIFSDLHMPKENGLMLLRRVKADPTLQAIPFVIFTASSGESGQAHRERALALGATKFVSSPVDPTFVLSMIEELLQRPARSPSGQNLNRR